MVKTAVAALDSAEIRSSKVDAFGPCRAIAAACRDGAHLDSSIRNDLGPTRKYEFDSALAALSQFSSISNAPAANPGIRNCLARVARMTAELEAEAAAKEPPRLADSRASSASSERESCYVNLNRIEAIRKFPAGSFDYRRLIRLLEELNLVYRSEAYMATAMLIRAITDHVPSLFGVRVFSEVASNYSCSKSFKGQMQNLHSSLRHVADSHLHTQIRRNEDLPTEHQVDFKSALDALLGEIIRISV
ncbi:hypothetical protein PS833_05773 [Pseudomonas fluorescens]|uniref:Uncharacterized protein n=2 Tax=Pseudomonas fluorescens TaxID=294 RepID=A0A5E7FM05_PSEFL|nr:hypothetical protein PS833_05773 [Pseudomonas fluorescens]